MGYNAFRRGLQALRTLKKLVREEGGSLWRTSGVKF